MSGGKELIEISVNGKSRQVPGGMTVASLLDDLALHPGMVVVEHNREILQRATLPDAVLRSGDVVEIVHFVGGG